MTGITQNSLSDLTTQLCGLLFYNRNVKFGQIWPGGHAEIRN